MTVDRLSVALDADLGAAVRAAASRSGVSVSRWLGDAASDHLRNELLGHALDEWEAEEGAFADADLVAVAEALGLATPSH